MQSLKTNLNLQLNQKHNQNISVKQSLNLQLNKFFGDMLTFYTLLFQSML